MSALHAIYSADAPVIPRCAVCAGTLDDYDHPDTVCSHCRAAQAAAELCGAPWDGASYL